AATEPSHEPPPPDRREPAHHDPPHLPRIHPHRPYTRPGPRPCPLDGRIPTRSRPRPPDPRTPARQPPPPATHPRVGRGGVRGHQRPLPELPRRHPGRSRDRRSARPPDRIIHGSAARVPVAVGRRHRNRERPHRGVPAGRVRRGPRIPATRTR